jgi:hypothetical protein
MIVIMSDMLATRLFELAQHEQHFATADILFRAGDPVRSLFLVVVGAIKLTRSLPHGAQLTLQHAGPGCDRRRGIDIRRELSLRGGRDGAMSEELALERVVATS